VEHGARGKERRPDDDVMTPDEMGLRVRLVRRDLSDLHGGHADR
jgi:hypothetical protein